jgi:hypothetical protein
MQYILLAHEKLEESRHYFQLVQNSWRLDSIAVLDWFSNEFDKSHFTLSHHFSDVAE